VSLLECRSGWNHRLAFRRGAHVAVADRLR
jgi:hypothetical protein